VRRLFILVLALAGTAPAVDWALFRSEPIEVLSNTEKDARQVLATFDQTLWLTAKLLGREEIKPLWPIRLIVVQANRGNSPYKSEKLAPRRDAYTAGLLAGQPVPTALLRDFVTLLLRDDTPPLPAIIENGLITALSHVEVDGNKITVLAPPAAQRNRDWARIRLFALDEEYMGRARVFFSNLHNDSGLEVAYRNSFGSGQQEMEDILNSYFAAGQFLPETIAGKPLNPERDYRPRAVDAQRAQVLLADLLEGAEARKMYQGVLNAGSKDPDAFDGAGLHAEAVENGSKNALAWLRHGLALKAPPKAREAFQRAAQLNPRWPEPHLRLGDLEPTAGRRYPYYKKAAELDPRNTALWEKLAETQLEAKDFDGAGLSFRTAARTATTEQERERLQARQREFEKRRIDLEIAERRRQEEEKQKELEKLQEEALANIRAAEDRARAASGGAAPAKVVEWWDGPRPSGSATGVLERVDCLQGRLRLALRTPDSKLTQYLIPDPSKIVLAGGGEHSLGCGAQKPPRRLKIDYIPKPDAKLATAGEVAVIEFQ